MTIQTFNIFTADEAAMDALLKNEGVRVESGGNTVTANGWGYTYNGKQAAGSQNLEGVMGTLWVDDDVVPKSVIDAFRTKHDAKLYKGTEPLSSILGVAPYRPRTGVRVRIKEEWAKRVKDGGFQTTDAAAKWLPSDAEFIGMLAAFKSFGKDLPTGLQVKALDGTFYTLTPARVNNALSAWINQYQTTTDAMKKALDDQKASPSTFKLNDIQWPPVFGGTEED